MTFKPGPFLPRLTDRDYGLVVLADIDVEAQLIAIRGLLARNSQAEVQTGEEIKALKKALKAATDEYAHYLDDRLVDQYHATVFMDAAHSLSAAGMLAPLFESYFTSVFPRISEHLGSYGAPSTSGKRGQRAHAQFWDPHFVFEKSGARKDLAIGIWQLAQEIGLDAHLPDDFLAVLSALFSYRNKIFHHGLEWPMEERLKFLKTAASKDWPEDWFDQSTSGGEPWIVYLSDVFIRRCLTTFEESLKGVGTFVRPDSPSLESET